jgi:hypothetical protein
VGCDIYLRGNFCDLVGGVSDKPISVGDLVQVIAHCCGYKSEVGMIAVALWIEPRKTMCHACRGRHEGLHVGARQASAGMPIEYLKRIDPPAEGEYERADTRIKRPVTA